jgi:hypothetical protein
MERPAEKQAFKINIERRRSSRFSKGFYAPSKRKEQDNSEGFEPTLAASTKNLGDRVEITIRDTRDLKEAIAHR